MNSIAIAICTYEHPDAVYDILGRSVQDLYDYHIDVYYYDGSKDTRTKEIVEAYQNLGFTNLYHYYLPKEPDRTKMAFTGEGMLHNYDYIWPCKDRCMFSKEALSTVTECLYDHPDAVLLSLRDGSEIEKKLYHDAPSLYCDHACVLTSINTILYNRETIIGSFRDWIYPNIFNSYYSHFFHTIAQKKELNVYALSGDAIAIYDSPLAVSSWEQNIFEVWKDQWIKVNELLPPCYDPYKDKIIKEAATMPHIFGDIERLQELHRNGILIPERISEAEKNWERVSNVPLEIVRDIAAGTYDPAHDLRRINSPDKFLNLMIAMHGMIQNGQITAAQIPWQSIKDYLKRKLNAEKPIDKIYIPLILGTVGDLEKMSAACPADFEQLAGYLQIIIDFLLLIDQPDLNKPAL